MSILWLSTSVGRQSATTPVRPQNPRTHYPLVAGSSNGQDIQVGGGSIASLVVAVRYCYMVLAEFRRRVRLG
jgi:hypothetical protein